MFFWFSIMTMAPQTNGFAQSYFPDLDLGDVRRNCRFAQVIDRFAVAAGDSLPAIFPDAKSYEGCLRLFHSDQATHENILGAHQVAVLDAIERLRTPVRLLHDATVLDFSGHTTLEPAIGPVGNGGGRGWIAHQTIAVDPDTRLVHGLVSQIMHVRPDKVPGETTADKRARESRESRLWIRGLDEIGPVPAGGDWIDVMDRGADMFELLQTRQDRRRQFLVRSTHNRALGAGSSEEKSEQKLHDLLRSRPATARWDLDIPAKTGVKPRTARMSGVALRTTRRVPRVKKGMYRPEPVTRNARRIWEESPPPGREALEWVILTNRSADTPAEIEQLARWYACRMQIEEYHKVQKSGAVVEGCQVQCADAMTALIAVLSVMSVMMMNLRLAARDPGQASRPATRMIPETWVRILERMSPAPRPVRTVRDFLIGLACLGGYKHHPGTHPPGWSTLWKGWLRLQIIILYELSSP